MHYRTVLMCWSFFKFSFQIKYTCCRRTVNATAPAARSAGSLDHLELSLVEFCQLVDFLLDIVSLVSFVFLFPSHFSFISQLLSHMFSL